MKRALAAVAACGLLAVPLSAQTTGDIPETAQPFNPLRPALQATMQKKAKEYCDTEAADWATFCGYPEVDQWQAIRHVLSFGEQKCAQDAGAPGGDLWGGLVGCVEALAKRLFTGTEPPLTQWMNGGASGEWDNWCKDFYYRFQPGTGGIHVRPLPLPPGAPMDAWTGTATTNPQPHWWVSVTNGPDIRARDNSAVALWSAHRKNVGPDTGPTSWFGAWNVEPYNGVVRWNMSTKAWWDPTLNKWNYNAYNVVPGITTNMTISNGYRSCPGSNAGSVDFDFYYEAENAGVGACIWYKPNKQISPSGYAYAEEVYIPWLKFTEWMNPTTSKLLGCELSDGQLGRIAKEFWDQWPDGTPTPDGVPVPPLDEVPEDQHCDNRRPNMKGMGNERTANASSYDCDTPTPPGPEPTPTPTGGTGDGAPDGWYDDPPPTSDPTFQFWNIQMPTWFQLPTLNFAGTCPVYDLDLQPVFTQSFVVDSHCGLVEQYRAVIAALMLACWTFAAAVIVMRA